MAPISTACLPASGICRNMWRDIVHGPKEGHGLDIPNCENIRNNYTGINIYYHIPINPITVESLTVIFTHVDS